MHVAAITFAAVLAAGIAAQEIPGVRASLAAQSLVRATDDVTLRLLLQVEKDAEIPAQLMNGTSLAVKCDDVPGNAIEVAGKGGSVAVSAGTRIERSFKLPVARFLPRADTGSIATVAVSWQGLAGCACTFKVAPDTRNVDLATLDFTKTQVVLVTSAGDMRLSFRPDKAQKHVENFVKLCLSGFYDGTRFHRVGRGFMIQGGCPFTKDESKRAQWGSGGPGYTIDAEFNDLRHLRGTLSMARGQEPNTAGSGFFIVHGDTPRLDHQYTAFGNLEEGADTLDRIAEAPVYGARLETPVNPVIIWSAIVLPVKK